MYYIYVRSDGDWYHSSGRRCLPGDHLGVDVAVELVVDVVVADVLQGGAAGRALEALHVEILLLYSHEDTAGLSSDAKRIFR